MNVPAGMSFAEAASIPEAWTTAYQLLYEIAKVKPDETVLIHAAASGVGTSLIQLCGHLGASSIAICSNQGKVEYCKKLGSFDGICYKKIPKFHERVDNITNHEGVDVILDPVMGSFFNANLECLGMDSRWIIYGFMGGVKVEQANMMKLLNKRASILTTTLRNRSDEYKQNLIQNMERDCYPAFESGDLKVIIDSTFALSNAKDALLYMQQNLNMGKIVLENDL